MHVEDCVQSSIDKGPRVVSSSRKNELIWFKSFRYGGRACLEAIGSDKVTKHK